MIATLLESIIEYYNLVITAINLKGSRNIQGFDLIRAVLFKFKFIFYVDRKANSTIEQQKCKGHKNDNLIADLLAK